MKKWFMAATLSLFVSSSAYGAAVSEEQLAQALQNLLQSRPEIILEVLRGNSEAVLDIAQQGSNLRRLHNLEAQWREDMTREKKVSLDKRPVLGNPDAKVKIIAFSDFTCNFCAQAAQILEKLQEQYGDQIGLVFKHLPLEAKGSGGLASAYFAAIALQDEKKAWEFYKSMYANRENLLAEGEPFLKRTAQELNLDMKKLQKDVKSKQVYDIMAEDAEDAKKLGVEGTPYFLVNNLVVRGAVPLDIFKAAIEMAKKN